MRTFSALAATCLAAALVATCNAQSFTTVPPGVGGTGRSTGSFAGGFTPTNIVNKPMSLGNATRPVNMQPAVMPKPQSTKVFNINSAFSKIHMPLFKSTAPKVPIAKAGPTNHLQPTTFPQTKKAPVSQPKGFPGLLPGFGG